MFNIDIETCSVCGGAMRIIAYIEAPVVIEEILAHLDAKAAAQQADSRFAGADVGAPGAHDQQRHHGQPDHAAKE